MLKLNDNYGQHGLVEELVEGHISSEEMGLVSSCGISTQGEYDTEFCDDERATLIAQAAEIQNQISLLNPKEDYDEILELNYQFKQLTH